MYNMYKWLSTPYPKYFIYKHKPKNQNSQEMKKVLLLSSVFLLAFAASSNAQDDGEFKPFKVDLSAGYAIPMGGAGSKGGALFVVEPKYAILPQLSLGLRIETAVMLSGVHMSTGEYDGNSSAKAAVSYVATGDYYFNNNDFRPFAGAGAGMFTTAGVAIDSDNPNLAEGSKFGGMFRAGFEYRHFRFGAEYNLISKSEVAPTSSTSNDGYTVKHAYVGIKLGVCIGGGRR